MKPRHLYLIVLGLTLSLVIFAGRPPVAEQAALVNYVESSAGLELRMEGGRTEVELGDANADGHVDIVSIGDHGSPFVNTNEHGVMVWFGDGQGGWSLFQSGDFGYGGIALGDVNDDGLMDVGYAMHHNYSGNDLGDQLIEVALGDGSGRAWTPWDDGLATNGEDWGMFGTDFADVDNDGDLDVASISFGCCSGIHVYLNQGDGTWTQSFAIDNGNSQQDVAFGDVNGDGNADLVMGYQNATVLTGDGAGGFSPADGNLPPGGLLGRSGTSVGDINGDGRDEIAFCGSGAPQVWQWSGPNTWVNLTGRLSRLSGCQATQLADMDGDGLGDVVMYRSGGVLIAGGNGAGLWRPLASFPTPGGEYAAMRVGDADHNGRPDIALIADEGGSFNSKNRLRFWKDTSVATALSVRPLKPVGGETWRAGSVHFVDWATAVPVGLFSSVNLELSTDGPDGPWTAIASGLPDNGRYQWLIPASTPASTNCYLRLTAQAGEGTAVALTEAFTIETP
ncbi:MAG: VCBS repeat-containing protein [Chloroflexota bacterium]